jgi:ATP-dependent Clp protease ATP-binding subunit ClpX
MLTVQIDTKDILFICGGAFVELEKTIAERYGISWSL